MTLLMTDLKVIENKISSVKKYLKIVEKYKKYSQKEIESDLTLRGAAERYLYLAAQAAIDLAEAVVSYKGFRKPSTFSETFHILNEENIISGELTEKMVKMTGFRNIVAHDYEDLNYNIVYEILNTGTKDVEYFLEAIKLVIE